MAVLKARVGGAWVEVSPSPISVPSGYLYFFGSWTNARAWQNREVCRRFNALWVWENATADPSSSNGPGTDVASWRLFGNVPVMTTAEKAAWTTVANGEMVWDLTLNRMYVYENAWIPVHPVPLGYQATLALQAGPLNDATKRALYTRTIVNYCTVVVSGQVDVTVVNSTGLTEIRLESEVQRPAGTSIGVVSGSSTRMVWPTVATVSQSMRFGLTWYDARPGDVVTTNIFRQSGTGTYSYNVNDGRFHGVSVIEHLHNGT